MKKATAKLMFLSAFFLITSIAWMPAGAGVNSGERVQMGGPLLGQPPKPKPSGPSSPDGGDPVPLCDPSRPICNPRIGS